MRWIKVGLFVGVIFICYVGYGFDHERIVFRYEVDSVPGPPLRRLLALAPAGAEQDPETELVDDSAPVPHENTTVPQYARFLDILDLLDLGYRDPNPKAEVWYQQPEESDMDELSPVPNNTAVYIDPNGGGDFDVDDSREAMPGKEMSVKDELESSEEEVPLETVDFHSALYGEDVGGVYRYMSPLLPHARGRPFSVNASLLAQLHFPLQEESLVTEKLTEKIAERFVFVTAGDHEDFPQLQALLLSVQTKMPRYATLVYDLGMDQAQLSQLSGACNVSVRTFDFSLYPAHVKVKEVQAWKPIIMHDVLREHVGALWLSPRTRAVLDLRGFAALYLMMLKKTYGVTMIVENEYSPYAVTHTDMLSFLPSRVSKLREIHQWSSLAVLAYRTRPVYDLVLAWWLLCALDPACIDPLGWGGGPSADRPPCQFNSEENFRVRAHCHKYEESALNILLANMFHYREFDYYGYARVAVANDTVVEGATVKVC